MDTLKKQYFVVGTVCTFMILLLVPSISFIYGKTTGEIIQNSVITLFFLLGFIYLLIYYYGIKRFDYDNFEHPYRLLIVLAISIILSIILPLVNIGGWVYLSIGIAIALFSNSFMAIYVTSGLIMISCIIKDNNINAFFIYFMAAAIGILLFQNIDSEFDVMHSLLIAAACQFVLEVAGFVLLVNKELSVEQFLIPLVNTIINILIVFWILKYFNVRIANKYRNKYLEINDQEYKALVALKNKSPREYWCSIHTAYLVDRISPLTGCDVNLAKTLSYYHRFKKAFSYSGSQSERFIKENEFPPEAGEALLHYWSKRNVFTTKEEGIVFIADNMIASIYTILEKDKSAKIDYAELYDTLINKDFMKKALSDSDLSVRDFKIIRDIILKERLYYDFLR